MKKYALIISLLLGLLCLGACSRSQQLQEYSSEFYSMDTIINIKLYSENQSVGMAALDAVRAEFERIDQVCDRYNENSEVYAVNHAGGVATDVSAVLLMIVEAALQMGFDSGGAFNIALGKVSDLWGFNADPHIPDRDALNIALSGADNGNIIADHAAQTVQVVNGAIMDLGAVAKGFAVDCAVKVLKDFGIEHAIINAGGNVYALGTKPDGSSWQVGVRDPRSSDANDVIAVIDAVDQALVTSGDDQRYFIVDDVRYHHILDPETGYPAQDCIFTTIICSNAMEADLLSTACFVLGPDGYQQLLDLYPDAMLIMMDSEGHIICSPEAETFISWTE